MQATKECDSVAELQPDEVLAIAHQLYEDHRLSGRQYDCWRTTRLDGMSFREAADYLRAENYYDISYWTVMMDSRYAHEIVIRACADHTEGQVRLGHTLAAGSETWFAVDLTLQAVARKTRVLVKKKPLNNKTLDFLTNSSVI